MDAFIGGVAASLIATAIAAAFVRGSRLLWSFPLRAPDVRGRWEATSTLDGTDDVEMVYITGQLGSRFRGFIVEHDDKSRQTILLSLSGRFYSDREFTYRHAYEGQGARVCGVGMMSLGPYNDTATGVAVFLGTHAERDLVDPTPIQVSMRRLSANFSLPSSDGRKRLGQ